MKAIFKYLKEIMDFENLYLRSLTSIILLISFFIILYFFDSYLFVVTFLIYVIIGYEIYINIPSERYRGRIHFEMDKCIACEVCVRVCPINLPVVDWVFNKEAKKKELRNYSIDFGACIFCGNCVEYCPTNCLSMTEEYELSTFDRHSLNYDNVALGRLPTNVTTDPSVRAMRELAYLPKGEMDPHEVPDSNPRVAGPP